MTKRLRLLFWKNFFQLLLVFVAIAEWVCVSWLLTHLVGVRIPSDLHVLVPIALYALNRWIVARPLPRRAA